MSTRNSMVGRRVRRGFTLIELLLVMVIISILAAIVVPKMVGRREQANHTAAVQQISNFKTMLSTYEIDNGKYPTTDEGLQALVPKYADAIPKDPWGNPYVYRCPGSNGADFDLLSTGASGQEGNADNVK